MTNSRSWYQAACLLFFLCLSGCWATTTNVVELPWKPELYQVHYLPEQGILTPIRVIPTTWGSVRPLDKAGERCVEHRVVERSVCYNAKLRSATIQDIGYEGVGCKNTPLVALFCPNLELVVVPEEKKDKPEDKTKK